MIEIDAELLDWIRKHQSEDPLKLRLKFAGDERIADAVTQIECRRSARKKLPRLLENKRFWFPSALAAEQCTSEALAQYHATLVKPGERVVDFTCGLGVDAFYLANVAQHVTAVEIDSHKADVARYNAEALGVANIDVVNADCAAFVSDTDRQYDTAFIDPARRSSSGGRVYALDDCQPNVVGMLDDIMRIAKRLIIKASPMLDISRLIADLQRYTAEIISLGTRSECKELVAVVEREGVSSLPDVKVSAVTIINGEPASFSYRLLDERNAPTPEYAAEIEEGQFLYEPWPAVMKAGPFKLLVQRCGVKKLSADTHLYVSDELVEFPGDVYRVIEAGGMDKRFMSHISKTYPSISVATRGMGIHADELRHRLKVKDGGNGKLFGVTVAGKRTLIISDIIYPSLALRRSL